MQAQCPACAEGNHDRKGEHLRVYPDGRFGCCVHPKDKEHRKRVFALVGDRKPGTFGVRLRYSAGTAASQSVKAALASFTPRTIRTHETELENGVRGVRDLSAPLDRPYSRTSRTGNSESRARARVNSAIHIDIGAGSQEKLKDLEKRTPRRLGRPLPLIPFIFYGPRQGTAAVAKLPLADIIALNLDHYRLDADFKHGLHYTALPTAWLAGFDAKQALAIGSRTAWVSENKDARAGFLEFTGQGLTTFERAQDRDERLMAVLGTRMLESQKRAYESAEAIELRQTAENSSLGAIAISVGHAQRHGSGAAQAGLD